MMQISVLKSWLRSIGQILKTNRMFLILIGIFIGTSIAYMSYVPIWDGWQNFRECYQAAARPTSLGSLRCFGHSAIFHTLLFGLTQKIDFGNHQLVYSLNVLLGLLALVCFKSLLAHLFGNKLSATERSLITFCFGLNPVFLVHVIQPSLDFSLPIFLTILLLALLKQRFFLASISGLMLAFTKEPGFMIYGVSVAVYVFLFLISQPIVRKSKFKLPKTSFVLLLPIILFIIYSIFLPPHAVGVSWIEVIRKMFSFNSDNNLFWSQISSLYLINFNWILTLFVVIGLLFQFVHLICKRSVMYGVLGFQKRSEKFYLYSLILLTTFFLTRIMTWNNPRYMLPLLPLFVLLFAESVLIVIRKNSLRAPALMLILILIYASSFRTFDPVSKHMFGTFKWGEHDILRMDSLDPMGYPGRDQLFYNFEITKLHFLTEEIVNKIGLDKTYVVHDIITFVTWFNFEDFRSFNYITGQRTLRDKNTIQVKFLGTFDNSILDLEEFYYIMYPNVDDSSKIKWLSYRFDIEEKITVDNDGYSMDVLHFVKSRKN